MIRRRDLWPLGAVGFILAVTASWWALALWPAAGAPEWLERTRSVCFNITESGLPDAKGWLLLLGQPPSMIGLLLVGWGREVRESFVHLASSGGGRTLLGAAVVAVFSGFATAGFRVADARLPGVQLPAGPAGVDQPRLDRPWPHTTGLVDQAGVPFSRGLLEAGPAMVTFAFGHCETVCPAVVHQALAARTDLSAEVPIVVITLDPWRDTPSRLDDLLRRFDLDPSLDHVVSGTVDAVQAALDAWGVERRRDMRTGDIVHPSLVYLVAAEEGIAYLSRGARPELVALGERLEWRGLTRE